MRQSRCVARWKRSSAPPESPPTETAERARQRAHHPAHHPDPHLPSGFPLREQQVLYFSHKGDFLDISIKHQGTCIMANHTSPRTPVAPSLSRGAVWAVHGAVWALLCRSALCCSSSLRVRPLAFAAPLGCGSSRPRQACRVSRGHGRAWPHSLSPPLSEAPRPARQAPILPPSWAPRARARRAVAAAARCACSRARHCCSA